MISTCSESASRSDTLAPVLGVTVICFKVPERINFRNTFFVFAAMTIGDVPSEDEIDELLLSIERTHSRRISSSRITSSGRIQEQSPPTLYGTSGSSVSSLAPVADGKNGSQSSECISSIEINPPSTCLQGIDRSRSQYHLSLISRVNDRSEAGSLIPIMTNIRAGTLEKTSSLFQSIEVEPNKQASKGVYENRMMENSALEYKAHIAADTLRGTSSGRSAQARSRLSQENFPDLKVILMNTSENINDSRTDKIKSMLEILDGRKAELLEIERRSAEMHSGPLINLPLLQRIHELRTSATKLREYVENC